MQHAEINHDQQQFKEQVKELKDDIAKLAAHREALEQENHQSSPMMQRLGKYIGFGAAGKLEWVCFKLNFKQEELARLMTYPEEPMNGVARPLNMVSALNPTTASETTREKMERMILENPSALEPYIRRVYQSILNAEQMGEC